MSRSVLLCCCAVFLAATCCTTILAQPSGSPPTTCQGVVNNIPLTQYNTESEVFIGSVENGTLSSVLAAGSSTPLSVIHLYGDSYSMGYAYGQLLSAELALTLPQAYDYLQTKTGLPVKFIEELLDITRNATVKYTPQWHFDYMHGVSDGTGGNVTFLDIWRVAMVPELIKASCSITGAWGDATLNGGLLQLRALDWGTDGPFQQWPILVTYHPNDGSFAHSSLTWIPMYATLTGFSSSNMAVSEKVWDAYKGLQNIVGYPWTFMLSDIMRFDHDIDEAISRISTGPRTCSIWVGLGQGARPNPRNESVMLPANFKLVADGFDKMNIYNPENFPIYPDHSYYPDLIFINKHVQPSRDVCMNELFGWSYGALTPEVFITYITAMEKTGDMHIAVMDFDAKMMYVASATPNPNSQPAYTQGFIQFDMEQMWSQPPPTKIQPRQ